MTRRIQLWADRSRAAAVSVALAIAMLVAAPSYGAGAPPDTSAAGVHGMVVSESEDAARAGVEILEHGGNAVDSALATALAVGVTNPAACGIGGGGFMLIYIAKSHAFYALDYRETAPLHARPDMYLRNGQPDEELARDGVLAVGVPGEIAGIDAALRRFGTMKFQQIAAPAEKLADGGFAASGHLADEIARLAPKLKDDPGLSQVFLKRDGSAPKAGDTIVEKNLAATLRNLGDDPVANFYHGEVATALAAFMKARGGLIGDTDLANYHPVWRDPIHHRYEGYDVYAMPPPSSGGVVLEMLGALDSGHLAGLDRLLATVPGASDRSDASGFYRSRVILRPDLSQASGSRRCGLTATSRNCASVLCTEVIAATAGACDDHGTSNRRRRQGRQRRCADQHYRQRFGAKLSVPALGRISTMRWTISPSPPACPTRIASKASATKR